MTNPYICPQCGSRGPFTIVAYAIFTWNNGEFTDPKSIDPVTADCGIGSASCSACYWLGTVEELAAAHTAKYNEIMAALEFTEMEMNDAEYQYNHAGDSEHFDDARKRMFLIVKRRDALRSELHNLRSRR